jgi:hypothetical protein
MDSFTKLLHSLHQAIINGVADYVSIVGFVLSGIAALLANSARKAAKEAKEELRKFDAVSTLSIAIRHMDDLKSFHRDGVTSGMAERYSSIRLQLVEIRDSAPNLSLEHREWIQRVVQFLRDMEDAVDKQQSMPPQKANPLISKHVDSLQALLTKIKA